MIILGIDTSCEQASCALAVNGGIVMQKSIEDKKKHSETLMPMVESFMAHNGVDINDVDIFAVSSGPGSFTGLRIGMSAVKGLAYSLSREMVCVKSLDILANFYPESDELICPVIDARNNQVYTAIYRWNGKYYAPVSEYMGIKTEELAGLLKNENQKVVFCGDAAKMHYEFFRNQAGIDCVVSASDNRYPSAGVLVDMVLKRYGLVETVLPEKAVPFYLRPSQAERLYGKS